MTEMDPNLKPVRQSKAKFFIGGALIIAAVIYLIVSSTQTSAQYFLTVSELNEESAAMVGKEVRVSGAILGDSIKYDAQTLTLEFTVVHIPGDNNEITAMGGLAVVLHAATLDSTLPRMQVVYHGVKPDLMRNEAQAIMTGRVGADGVFQADELLLKCPTKYEEAVPDQVNG